MPRTPSIRYFESRRAYYTQFQGRQRLLADGPADGPDGPDGPTYRAAVQRFAQIMHADEVERAEDNSQVSTIIVRYYHHLDREGRKATPHQARTLLDPAIADFGTVKVKELKPFIVRDWVEKQRQWNSTTKHTAIGCLIRAFYWSKKQGMIRNHPIAEMEKPEKLVRGKEVVIPDELQEVLIRCANPEFAKFLRMLRGTGARPGEVMNAECKHDRPDVGALGFPWNPPPGEYRWKSGKKTKRDRVIYLTPDLQALVEEEIARRGGKGPIFQTARRLKWRSNNLVIRLDKLLSHQEVKTWCKANGFNPAKVMCYSFRHGYITRMLMAGCPVKVLTDLCGTSVAMIEKTYSHAHDDLRAMRRLFLQFSRPAACSESPPSPADRNS
jgi:integrase